MQPNGGDPSQPYGQPAYPQQPYGAQPYVPQPYASQPYGAQPYAPQPYAPQPYGYPPVYARPGAPTSIGWVIVGFIFFWPLGIAAVINQMKIGPAWQIGDDGGAYRAAASAKKFGLIALLLGIAVWVLVIVLDIAVFTSTHHCSYSSDYC